MEFDFEQLTDRRRSACYKWDGPLPEGVSLTEEERARMIPLWVADMDFKAAPCIIEALRRRVEHGVFGYTCIPESYYEAVIRWFSGRHGFVVRREWMLYTIGVVPAVSAVLKALSEPGGGVIIQTPVYNAFFSCIRNCGLQAVPSPLIRVQRPDGRFTYEMDFEDLERRCADPANRILLLCNPHNPAGRVWTAAELARVAEITRRHGTIVVSDEIHCELVRPGTRYTPFACASPEGLEEAVLLNSPSKSFNTAGLQMANVICPDAEWRARIDRVINDWEICESNPFGYLAHEAAYTPEGARWLDELNTVIWHNYDLLCSRLRGLPFPVCELEGTYLAWVDISTLGLSSAEVERELLQHELVWVNAGQMYGDDRFIRINLACPSSLLTEGVDRVADGLVRLYDSYRAK
ncbi:MAG: pyridoxal phosphate-dependent aminotransferase [Bacteroidales bacterium]|nr:pyridoxal phosphate-dependent aminotransferase [Bacteroidales bacterium]